MSDKFYESFELQDDGINLGGSFSVTFSFDDSLQSISSSPSQTRYTFAGNPVTVSGNISGRSFTGTPSEVGSWLVANNSPTKFGAIDEISVGTDARDSVHGLGSYFTQSASLFLNDDQGSAISDQSLGNVLHLKAGAGWDRMGFNMRLRTVNLQNLYISGTIDMVVVEDSSTAVTPEPASLALWGLGSLGCMVYGYRKRKLAAA